MAVWIGCNGASGYVYVAEHDALHPTLSQNREKMGARGVASYVGHRTFMTVVSITDRDEWVSTKVRNHILQNEPVEAGQ